MADVVRELKDKAAQATTKGKLPAALEAWRQVVEVAPDDLAARQKVAELLIRLNQRDEAINAYEDVARRYAQAGVFFKASAVCRIILGIDPKHQRTQELIATLFARSEKPLPSKPGAPKPGTEAAPTTAATAAPSENAEVDVDLDIEVVAPPTASGLPSIPLFSMLNAAELKQVLATAMEVRSWGVGEVLVSEGSPGDAMYALVEGTVGVYRGHGTPDERRVASMSAGDIFGEVALVAGTSRVATVVTENGAVALEFSRAAMEQVIAKYPRVGESLEQFARERLLANMMRASVVLGELPDSARRQLAARFTPRTFANGQTIITEGQPASAVHMLLRGRCAVKHQSGNSYPDLREGDLFGEVAVLTDGPATATVIASGPVVTLEIGVDEFKSLVLNDFGASMAVKALVKTRLERTARYDRVHSMTRFADRRV